MRYDEYYRLHMACLDMAKQTSVPDVQARWSAMAEGWLKLANEMYDRPNGVTDRFTPSPHLAGMPARRPHLA